VCDGCERIVKDAVWQHPITEREERARVPQSNDRSFGVDNRALYYNDKNPPLPRGETALDVPSPTFLAH
jgi:hypothetical protein